MNMVLPLSYAEPPDVPEGMTLAEYRRSRRPAAPRSKRRRRMVAALRPRRRRTA
jgi:hypothetical protein